MIDIHTHILPCLDDGAQTKADALALLHMLEEQGVKSVALTPHYYGKKNSVEDFLRERESAFAKIEKEIPTNLQVFLGAEVHLTGVNDPTNEKICYLSIGDTDCVLVELPFFTKWSNALFEKLSEFISDTGYTPIVAHIERYDEVKRNPKRIETLIDMGCLIQVNTRAFIDRRTRKFAFRLLRHGMVHCLGTDAHDPLHRSPDYHLAKNCVYKKGYKKEWERVQERMERVLEKGCVRTSYTPLKKIFGVYF